MNACSWLRRAVVRHQGWLRRQRAVGGTDNQARGGRGQEGQRVLLSGRSALEAEGRVRPALAGAPGCPLEQGHGLPHMTARGCYATAWKETRRGRWSSCAAAWRGGDEAVHHPCGVQQVERRRALDRAAAAPSLAALAFRGDTLVSGRRGGVERAVAARLHTQRRRTRDVDGRCLCDIVRRAWWQQSRAAPCPAPGCHIAFLTGPSTTRRRACTCRPCPPNCLPDPSFDRVCSTASNHQEGAQGVRSELAARGEFPCEPHGFPSHPFTALK